VTVLSEASKLCHSIFITWAVDNIDYNANHCPCITLFQHTNTAGSGKNEKSWFEKAGSLAGRVSERGFMSEQRKKVIYGREKHRVRRNERAEE